MKINLADYHPILDIQENTLFTSNGNIVVCFRTILPEIYSLADKDFEEIHNTWFQAFKYLPYWHHHSQAGYLPKNNI